MQKIRLIYIPVFIFLLSPLLCTPTLAGIISNVYNVDGYVVTCGDILSNGLSLQVADEHGAPISCAVVKVSATINLNIKYGQILTSENTFVIDMFSKPTAVDGKTAVSVPNIDDNVTTGVLPEKKAAIILALDCTKILPKDVYVLEGCATKNPNGCCSISITVPASPVKTYSFCYSSYDIPEADYAENCTVLKDTFSLLSQLPSFFTIDGFQSIVEWTDKAGCNYETGECSVPTAITIASFDAEPGNGKVILKWTTGDETDNLGFNIYRSESRDGGFTKINDALIPSQAPKGLGASYAYEDTAIQNGRTYFYKLEDVDINGVKTKHGPVSTMPRIIYEIGN